MARIRSIKPEFPQSESIGRLSRDARLLFVQLWTIADDAGRTRAASRMLASLLFPFDEDAPGLIEAWLSELEREGFVTRYTVHGSTYLQIHNWLKHQKIDHPSQSRLPECPPDFSKPRENSRSLAPDLGPRTMDLGKDHSDADASAAPSAAPAKPPVLKPLDLDKAYWDTGKAFLIANGVPPERAGGLLGKWRKAAGREAVVAALARAEAENPSDMVPFIEGCLKNGQRSHGVRTSAPASKVASIFAQIRDDADAGSA